MVTDRPVFLLRLQGLGDGSDLRMLRALLKRLLRDHGFRCLTLLEEASPVDWADDASVD